MKKFLQNTLARALCVLAFGILLIVFAAEITEWIVMLCGIAAIVAFGMYGPGTNASEFVYMQF